MAENTVNLWINRNGWGLILILSSCFLVSCMLLKLLFKTAYCLQNTSIYTSNKRMSSSLNYFKILYCLLPSSNPVPAPQIRSHDFWCFINLCVRMYTTKHLVYISSAESWLHISPSVFLTSNNSLHSSQLQAMMRQKSSSSTQAT